MVQSNCNRYRAQKTGHRQESSTAGFSIQISQINSYANCRLVVLHFRVGTELLDLLLELVSVVVAAEGSLTATVHVVNNVEVSAFVDELRVHSQAFEVFFPAVGERVAVEVHLARAVHVVFHVVVGKMNAV